MQTNQKTDAKTLIQAADALFSQFRIDEKEDEIFFQSIIDEFSEGMDVLNQLKQFHAWCIDQHPTKINNCRFRFRAWLVNAQNYQNKKITNGSAYPLSPKKLPTQQ